MTKVSTNERYTALCINYLIDVIFAKFAWAVFWTPKYFALNSLTELDSLKHLGMLLHVLGARKEAVSMPCATKEAVSMPYRIVWTLLDLNLVSFLTSYGFLIIGKTLFIISGAKLNVTLNISIGYGDES